MADVLLPPLTDAGLMAYGAQVSHTLSRAHAQRNQRRWGRILWWKGNLDWSCGYVCIILDTWVESHHGLLCTAPHFAHLICAGARSLYSDSSSSSSPSIGCDARSAPDKKRTQHQHERRPTQAPAVESAAHRMHAMHTHFHDDPEHLAGSLP